MPTQPESQAKITFTLNGSSYTVTGASDRSLLDVLREDLDLTGTKKGCDYEGQCGSCTVLLAGRPVRACLTPIRKVAGQSLVTVEGLATGDQLHPLQQAFIDHGAVQCGYCIPGVLMSAAALLDRTPNPNPDDVRQALQGNLCRCTGYIKIIDAILAAARTIRQNVREPAPTNPAEAIGGHLRRHTAAGKVTGALRYAGDVKQTGMLYACVLRSPHAHARIDAINTAPGLALPGVRGIFTAADIPGVKTFYDNLDTIPPSELASWRGKTQEPLLAIDRVRMVGDPVAIIVADDEQTARAGAARIDVHYTLLPPVFEPEQALQPTCPPLHATGNSYETQQFAKDDFQAAVDQAEIFVETQISMPSQDHVTLEPEAMLAYPDSNGQLVVIGPTQQPHARQEQIAMMLNIPVEQVRVIAPEMGGSFGGRHHFWPVVAIALPAYLMQQPVKMVYSRREVFEATVKRHPFRFKVQIGARPDGKLVGLRVTARGDAGPYGGAPGIADLVSLSGIGPYRWAAYEIDTQVAHTNGANSGPFRGYGMPQGALALENGLDELAARLDIDPLTLRRRNALDLRATTPLGHPFDEPFEFNRVLDLIEPEWMALKRETQIRRESAASTERFGAGLAAAWYRFSKAGATRISAQAGLDSAGQITLYFTAVRAGQGLNTIMSQLASHELGVPREAIALVNGDTSRTTSSGVYGGCRSTYWIGGAIRQASRVLKHAILDTAAEMLDVPVEKLYLTSRRVYVRERPQQRVSLREIAAEWQRVGHPVRYTGVQDLSHQAHSNGQGGLLGHYVAGIALAQVRVNLKNGKVDALKVVVAQDVGRAINPVDLQGQVEGAVVMELGATLMEEYIPGQTLDLKSYRIPRIKDVPEITVLPLEYPSHDGPHGAKGVGEAVMGHTRAAIINGFYNATGVRLSRIPATPAYVRSLLET